MENKGKNKYNEHYHDVMTERKWFTIAFGFGNSKSAAYMAYVGTLLAFGIYQMSLNVFGMLLVSGQKLLIVDALRVMVNGTFATWLIVTRVLTRSALEKVTAYIRSGFYKYKGENLFEEQIKMKEDVVEEIRTRCREFVFVWSVGGFAMMIFYPVTQAMRVTEEEYERTVDIANPYLPAFFYMPFSTRTPLGLIVVFTIVALFNSYCYGVAMIMNEIYMSTILQLRVQLQVLNYSIRNIHRRAILMYARLSNIPQKAMQLDEIQEDKLFQKCVLFCLRSNVEHHQLLLRFTDEVLKFSGSTLLLLINIASAEFALNLYIVTQNPALNISIKCCIIFFVEQLFTLSLCAFGEIIMTESSRLFESLYSVPWFHYSKAFNQTLRVFMCYTMKPIRIKSLLLDFTASLETYANFLSVMYKIANILKQSDSI